MPLWMFDWFIRVVLGRVLWDMLSLDVARDGIYGYRLAAQLQNIFKKVKEHIAVNGYSHFTATGRDLPHWITQCYLPPDTSVSAPP